MRAALALAAGFLVLLVGGGARFAIGLTFKPIVDEFGWARGELGLAVGLYMVVSAFATFLAGRLADRLSPRALLIGGTIVGGIGIALMSLVSQPWHALLLYGVVFAIGNGAASLVIVGVIVMRAYPGRAGLANAVAISGMSVGQLVMIAMLAPVMVQVGWRSVFVWIGVAHLVLLPLLLGLPGAGAGAGRRSAARGLSLREAARTRQFWLLLADLCDLRARRFLRHHACGGVRAGQRPRRAVLRPPARPDGPDRACRRDRGRHRAATASVRSGRPPRSSRRASLVFGWIAIDQSLLSIAIFALVFGATFLVTAPLTVVFVRENFGTKNLGALAGADHHGAPDLRRARRLCGRGDLRRDRHATTLRSS